MNAGGAATAELQEVRGPSALGGGRHRFFELLWLMSVTEFRKTFFGTALGYVWSLVRPLMLFAVLLLVFTQVFRLGSQVLHYPVLLLFNIVVFGFFQEATGGAVTSVLAQEGIVRKTQFPRLVIPLSVVLTSLFTLGLNLIVVLVFLLAFGVAPMWTWLLFPLVVLPLLVVFVSALAMLLSSLNVRFRDVAIIWTVLATALNYGTPIIYPLEIVPEGLKHALMANPLTPIFQQAHVWIVDSNAEGVAAAAGGPLPLVVAGLIYVAVCIAGVWVFNREAPRIAEQL